MILVLKVTKQYTHNMILMSRYKGLHGGKWVQKYPGKAPPPFSGNVGKKTFFLLEVLPYSNYYHDNLSNQ